MIGEGHKSKLALATELQTLRGKITSGGSTSGKIYRLWMDLKAVIAGHDRHSSLETSEFMEDATQQAYYSALKQDFLPACLRQMIAEQQKLLRALHDEIRALGINMHEPGIDFKEISCRSAVPHGLQIKQFGVMTRHY